MLSFQRVGQSQGLAIPFLMSRRRGSTPASVITPLPAGIAAMWDAASLVGLADGDAVTSWTDDIGGSVATPADGGTSHTFVADSGGHPAVRLSGASVLATTDDNAANTAMSDGERGFVVVARNFLGAGDGQVNPCIAAAGTSAGMLLQATPTQTGCYGAMFDCADEGVRTIGFSASDTGQFAFQNINGTAIGAGNAPGGQIFIGGWQNAGTACCGIADILAVIVFDHAPTAADFKQVHRHYCELLGQERPGGADARNVTFIGDSLTQGYPIGVNASYALQMVNGLGLPWGTWDQMGVAGFTWVDMKNRSLVAVGDVSAAIGNRNIVCIFEFANMRGGSVTDITDAARAMIDAVLVQETDVDVVFGTTTDGGDSAGIATRADRTSYNAFWDDLANRDGIAGYVQLHLDPNIGVEGAAPTDGSGSTYYQPDNLHLTEIGYGIMDNGPYGFRAAVVARLSA